MPKSPTPMKRCIRIFCFVLTAVYICFAISACRSKHAADPGPVREIPIPTATDDGWEVGSLASANMDAAPISRLLNRLDQTSGHRIHSILVVRNGKLVFEKYYSGLKFNLGQYTGETGYDLNDLHVLCSATKSVCSALIGIAMDRGLIGSIEEKVYDFFPEYADLVVQDPAKAGMTLRHLLTMTSGLTYDDESLPYTDTRNDMNRFFRSSDPIRFLLALPLYAEPGTVFNYENCNTNILGHILYKVTGERLDFFAQENLFDKLNIVQHEWQIVKNNVVLASGDLHLRPRDMARFGLLFLRHGEWEGETIISSEWCETSTAAQLNPNDDTHEFTPAHGYGYHWWMKDYHHQSKTYHSYFAWGWGGQLIVIIPELDLVVVTTAGNWYDPEAISPFAIVEEYIIPSVDAG